MAGKVNFLQKRTRSTFLTSLISISLVLLFLGIFAAGALYGRYLLRMVQEEFEMMIVLKTGTSTDEIDALKADVSTQPFVREIRYISKDDAAKDFMNSVGEDFMDIMDGVNPLPASLNIRLKADYANPDSVALMNLYFRKYPEIAEVEYPVALIDQIRKNTSFATKATFIVGFFVLLIAFFVINSTIQLAVFSRRLIIRSMQLIGATSRFIRTPFVRIGILQGFFGAILADIMLIGLILLVGMASQELGDVKMLLYQTDFMILLGGIVIFGALLGWFSSRMVVNRFLNKNLDDLI